MSPFRLIISLGSITYNYYLLWVDASFVSLRSEEIKKNVFLHLIGKD